MYVLGAADAGVRVIDVVGVASFAESDLTLVDRENAVRPDESSGASQLSRVGLLDKVRATSVAPHELDHCRSQLLKLVHLCKAFCNVALGLREGGPLRAGQD